MNLMQLTCSSGVQLVSCLKDSVRSLFLGSNGKAFHRYTVVNKSILARGIYYYYAKNVGFPLYFGYNITFFFSRFSVF